MENGSSAFYLSTFEASHTVQIIIFGLCLLLYVVGVLANLLVFVAVLMSADLHKPMFIFLGNLALADIICSTLVVPKQLHILLTGDSRIQQDACLVQLFCAHVSSNLEVLTLSAMAFDRYVAICHPLRYHIVVTNKRTLGGLLLMWVIISVAYGVLTIRAAGLKFRDYNRKIQGLFCDNMTLVILAESDSNAKINNAFGTVLLVVLFMLPLVFIIYSYTKVFIECRIKRSTEVTRNSLSTLLTHFLAVSIFFLSIFASAFSFRLVADTNSSTVGNIRCIVHLSAFIIPISNVIIYYFRTKELRKGISSYYNKIFLKKTLFPRFFKVSTI